MDSLQQLIDARQALKRNDFHEAIQCLEGCFNEFVERKGSESYLKEYKDKLAQLSGRYQGIQGDRFNGTISKEHEDISTNQIRVLMFQFIKEFEEQIKDRGGVGTTDNQKEFGESSEKGTKQSFVLKDIELTLHGDLSSYTEAEQELLIQTIANLLKIENRNVIIKKKYKGSIKILMAIPENKIQELANYIDQGKLVHLQVMSMKTDIDLSLETSKRPTKFSGSLLTHKGGGIKSRRFREMEETGQIMHKEIRILEDLLVEYEIFSGGDLSSYTLAFLKERITSRPLRAYFTQKVFEYIVEENPVVKDKLLVRASFSNLYFSKLPFLIEMIFTLQLIDKQMLNDSDQISKSHKARLHKRLISSNLFRELIFQYADREIRPLLNSRTLWYQIREKISKILFYIDLGNRIEKEYNHYYSWGNTDRIPKTKENSFLYPLIVEESISYIKDKVVKEVPDKRAFVEAYFQRMYLTNVNFFESIVDILLMVSGNEGIEGANLKRFAIQYGHMLGIINEYADFAYSSDKRERELLAVTTRKTTDYFSALYNHNITLPLIFHLKQDSRRKIEAYLSGGRKNKKMLTQYPDQIVSELKQSGAIQKCINLSRELAISAPKWLDDNNPATRYLKSLCNIALDNKFYQVFSDSLDQSDLPS